MTEYFEPKIEHIERDGWGYKNLDKLDLTEEEVLGDEYFEENHKKYKSMIKEILSYYDLAKNSDFILFIEFLRLLDLCTVTHSKENFIFKIPRDKIKLIPNPDTSSRIRREFNNKDLFLATNPKVLDKRRIKRKVIRKFYGETNK